MLGKEILLNKEQSKVVNSNVFKNNIIKGNKETGKTTSAIYRSLHLKNNYCLYEEDKILMICNSVEDKISAENLYIKAEESDTCISLFSFSKDKFFVYTLEEILFKYFFKDNEYEVLTDNNKKQSIMKNCIVEMQQVYGEIKILNFDYVKFFLDEIKWIKSFNFMYINEYQNVVRQGRKPLKGEGPQRILKNSIEREIIFELMNLYNKSLKEEGLIDYEDIALILLNDFDNNLFNKYTHIIVDDAQGLSKVEFQVIKKIFSGQSYGSINYIINTDESLEKRFYLINNKRINYKAFEEKPKVFNLKEKTKNIIDIDKNLINSNCKNYDYSIEQFKYKDIRRNREFDFIRDYSNIKEIIIKNENNLLLEQGNEIFIEEELKQLPVYSDIAAGEPILINSELEGSFYLPKLWLKGMNDCFILKVKGDSMIGADINNDDYVIIRKQASANHNDIVAVDMHGSATLKRLSIGKEKILLLPENEKYDPINVDEETMIIGIAVGVIKSSL